MWVEGRIHAASSWPTPVHGDRYGLLMIDPGALDDPEAPAARLSYLGSVEPVADSVDAVQRRKPNCCSNARGRSCIGAEHELSP
jgi:hypothetical protein